MDDIDAAGRHFDFSDNIEKRMQHIVFEVQREFCEEIERIEGIQKFSTNEWKTEGGNGVTQILEQEYGVFEKVCVSASVAHGDLPASAFCLFRNKDMVMPSLKEKPQFFTTGIIGVAYPKNPNVPVLHFNYRYFEIKLDAEENVWWFGGSTDLVPSILDRDDCQHFHKVLKTCCDEYNRYYYAEFKKNADKQFHLNHRGENRGIGGLFFEKLNYPDKKTCFQFISKCMNNIIPSYMPLVYKNKDKSFLNDDRQWQLLLRGRAVEYGFICDRPIEYALMIPGVLCDKVLAFLPPSAKWQRDPTPDKNSKENELLDVLRNPRDWV